jgi:hypothetical protein
MKTKFLMSAVLVLTLTLAACAPKAAAAPKKGAVSTAIPPVAMATKVPTKIAQASPTIKPDTTPTQESASTPTPVATLVNEIVADDQMVKSDSVLVNMVVAMKPGWVVILTDENDQPGTVLGYAAVPAGTSNDIKVTIDSKKATDKMIAMLTIDAGTIGTFEYPGPDVAVKSASVNSDVMAIFNRLSATSN